MTASPPRSVKPTDPSRARRSAQVAARRHSRLVRSLKFVLPGIALLGVAVLAGKALLFSYVPDLKLPTVLFSKDGITMVEPRLSGRSRDRAYEISALRAVQSLDDPKRVRLERVDGRIELSDKQWAKVEAKAGLYDGTSERLRLEQGLSVVTSNGYRAATDGADFDLATGKMVSRAPVRIDGPAATIEGAKLEISDDGRTFVFSGGIRMEIRPSADKPAGPADRLADSEARPRTPPP